MDFIIYLEGTTMKKYMIIFLIFISAICNMSVAESATDMLTRIENSILGVEYTNEKTESRLSRLEEYVYGTKKSGSSAERLKRLSKDLNADVIGQEINPCEDTIGMTEDMKEDESVDYPIIDEVEKHLSIKNTQKQSLHSRIVTIEKKLFNNVYDTDDYYTRVERIKGKIYKNQPILAKNNDEDEDIRIPEYIPEDDTDRWGMGDSWRKHNMARSYGNSFGGINPFGALGAMGQKRPLGSADSKISRLEQKIFNTTFSDENNNDRLARLENSVFDTQFYYDDVSERINRLEGAIKGQRTSDKYDNNKLQQRLNTAMQIGAMVLMVLAFIL